MVSRSKKERKLCCRCCGFAIMTCGRFTMVVGGGFRSDLWSFSLWFVMSFEMVWAVWGGFAVLFGGG